VRPVTVMPAPMSIFDLFQLAPLLVRQDASHLLVRFCNDFMDAPAGVAPHFVKLCSSFIQRRRNFGHLLRRQTQFSLQSLPHSLADHRGTRRHEEKMPRVRCPYESTRHTAGEKNQEETGDQFPLQRAVHRENSV